MRLCLPQRSIDFPRRPLIMGIVNVNDDSFCQDGTLDPDAAAAQVGHLAVAGADIIDLGAESARTNRGPISVEEEIARLKPILAQVTHPGFWTALRPRDADQLWPPLIAVNTWRPEIAAAVLPLGVDILNDMGGLPHPENARLCARHQAALVLMHTVGQPKVAHFHQQYPDLWGSLFTFFDQTLDRALEAGLTPDRIILDPGLDFAKQRDDNLRILQGLDRLTQRYPSPLLLPVSRKTVIGEVLNLPNPRDRDPGTLACMTAGLLRGAAIFRVHHVDAVYAALKVLWAVETAAPPASSPLHRP